MIKILGSSCLLQKQQSYHRVKVTIPWLKHQYSVQNLADAKRWTNQELTKEPNHVDKEILLYFSPKRWMFITAWVLSDSYAPTRYIDLILQFFLGLNLYLYCSHKGLEEMSLPCPFICKTEKQFLVQRLRASAGRETSAHTTPFSFVKKGKAKSGLWSCQSYENSTLGFNSI